MKNRRELWTENEGDVEDNFHSDCASSNASRSSRTINDFLDDPSPDEDGDAYSQPRTRSIDVFEDEDKHNRNHNASSENDLLTEEETLAYAQQETTETEGISMEVLKDYNLNAHSLDAQRPYTDGPETLGLGGEDEVVAKPKGRKKRSRKRTKKREHRTRNLQTAAAIISATIVVLLVVFLRRKHDNSDSKNKGNKGDDKFLQKGDVWSEESNDENNWISNEVNTDPSLVIPEPEDTANDRDGSKNCEDNPHYRVDGRAGETCQWVAKADTVRRCTSHPKTFRHCQATCDPKCLSLELTTFPTEAPTPPASEGGSSWSTSDGTWDGTSDGTSEETSWSTLEDTY